MRLVWFETCSHIRLRVSAHIHCMSVPFYGKERWCHVLLNETKGLFLSILLFLLATRILLGELINLRQTNCYRNYFVPAVSNFPFLSQKKKNHTCKPICNTRECHGIWSREVANRLNGITTGRKLMGFFNMVAMES